MALLGSRIICNNFTYWKKDYRFCPEMKTTMMAGVCLLALVLTFTIVECGPSQEKRQQSPTGTPFCERCVKDCQTSGQTLEECIEWCCHYGQGGAAGDDNNGPNYDNVPDEDNGSDDNNGSDDDNGSVSGAAVAGATIFSVLLVAVASAMN